MSVLLLYLGEVLLTKRAAEKKELYHNRVSLVAQIVKKKTNNKNCLQCRRPRFDPWVGKIPFRRAWQPTPIFLPGEFPWTEEPGRLQSRESQRVGRD